MTVSVSLSELGDTLEMVSAGAAAGIPCEGFVCKRTGRIYVEGDGIDEDGPSDSGNDALYAAVPTKRELGLAQDLVRRFMHAQLPEHANEVREYFRHRGAYSKFKALLDRTGQLDAWYAFETAQTEAALRDWCKEHGFAVI